MLHDEKFELIIHKHKPESPVYELPFVLELMTYYCIIQYQPESPLFQCNVLET